MSGAGSWAAIADADRERRTGILDNFIFQNPTPKKQIKIYGCSVKADAATAQKSRHGVRRVGF
jgi:hypothetical protein